MCESCGCGITSHTHTHDGHTHTHEHDGYIHTHEHDGHSHDHELSDTRELKLEQKIMAGNDEFAAKNRVWLAERGVTALNLISAPGSGKTFLLEKTLEQLKGKTACSVIAGDQCTDNDARRLAGKGARVCQIETRDACHLDAARVHAALPGVVEEGTRLLFIENVGNLVCPAAFDLGENFKVAILSVTEGEDKPVKYPKLFADAGVAVITKVDLAEHVGWNAALCRKNIQLVHPGLFVFELSAKSGHGMEAWLDYLQKLA